MADVKLRIERDEAGEFVIRLFDAAGAPVSLSPGGVAPMAGEKSPALYHKAVQAGLKLLYDRQQARAGDAIAG